MVFVSSQFKKVKRIVDRDLYHYYTTMQRQNDGDGGSPAGNQILMPQEESKEPAHQSSIAPPLQSLINPEFIRKMPNLSQSAKMKDVKVYKNLSKIPSSDYYGVRPSMI